MSPSSALPFAMGAAPPYPRRRRFALVAFAALAPACQNTPPEPTPERPATPQQAADNNGSRDNNNADNNPKKAAGGDDKPKVASPEPPKPPSFQHPINGHEMQRPVAVVQPSPDDPVNGKFSLEDATKGLPAGKQILATIETSMGKLECKLFDDKAPITVANFVGLARGVRPWKTPEGKWEKKPAYDGTVFHRIIKGFMIQGGDAKKNGTGEAGYVIPDEMWKGATHDRAGLLCMANRGANTNSAQFFITDDAAPHLDSGYTIFGECGPVDQIHKIASLEVRGDKPTSPPDIKKVTITRK